MIIVLGNGKSRLNFDLDELSEHAITFGCNALYRDFAPDILLTVDIPITHEILSTEYTKRNKLYTSISNSFTPEFRNQFEVKHIIENSETDYKFLLNGVGTLDEPKHYITWYNENDLIYDFPWKDDNWGMSAGITAIRLAHVLYPDEKIILIGFDVFGERNNVYDGTNTYPPEGTKNTGETVGFLGGFDLLTTKYNRIDIERVSYTDDKIPNVKNITEKNLWQQLK